MIIMNLLHTTLPQSPHQSPPSSPPPHHHHSYIAYVSRLQYIDLVEIIQYFYLVLSDPVIDVGKRSVVCVRVT